MSFERVRVVKSKENYIWVEKAVSTACQGCSASASCGASVIQSYLSKSHRVVQVTNACNAKTGDHVEVLIADSLLVKLSLLTYFFPLVCFVLFCCLGGLLSDQYTNLASFLMGVFGLVVSFLGVRLYVNHWFSTNEAPLKAVRVVA